MTLKEARKLLVDIAVSINNASTAEKRLKLEQAFHALSAQIWDTEERIVMEGLSLDIDPE